MSRIVALALIVAMTCGLVWAADSQNSHSIAEKQCPQQTKQGTDDAPFVIKIIGTPSNHQPPNNYTCTQANEGSSDIDLVWPTRILAVATVGLLLFTGFLWKSTSNLVKDAKITAEKDLRAYIGIDE